MKLTEVLLIFTSYLAFVGSNKIIIMLGPGAKSHKNVHYPIAKELVKRGHDVTMVSIHQPHVKVDGLKEISIDEAKTAFLDGLPSNFDENGVINVYRVMFYVSASVPVICRPYLNNPEVQALLGKGQTFDLAILNGLFSEFLPPIAKRLARSIVYVTPGELDGVIAWNLNNPLPTYVPSIYLTPNIINMNFFDRLTNVVANAAWLLFREFYVFPQVDKVIQEFLPGAMSAKEAEKQIELVLVNRRYVLDYTIPLLPFVHEIGGITIVPAKKLPKEIEEFVNASGSHGFIIASFGSLVSEDMIPEHAKRAMIEAFSRIPQRVVWKYTAPLKDISPNVKQMSWLPQNDLLGHPKAVAFLTHGGHFGLMETVFHGVPIVGLPVFADQPGNILRAENKLLGKGLNWNDVTADKIVQALNTVVNDTRYKESAKQHSELFKDVPMKALDTAVYWLEHILRHGGRFHLRAEGADNMNLFQYFMLDVIGFVTAIFVLVIYIVVKLISLLCCKKGMNQNKKKLKTK